MTAKVYQVHVRITHQDPTKNANFVDFQTVELPQALRIAHGFQNSLSVIGAIKIKTQIVEVPTHELVKPIPAQEEKVSQKFSVNVRLTNPETEDVVFEDTTEGGFSLPEALKIAHRYAKNALEQGGKAFTQCIQLPA